MDIAQSIPGSHSGDIPDATPAGSAGPSFCIPLSNFVSNVLAMFDWKFPKTKNMRMRVRCANLCIRSNKTPYLIGQNLPDITGEFW